MSNELYWVGLGFISQFVFFMRFFIQWIATERKKEVHIPDVFWYLSLCGGLGLLVYSIHRRDIVFIAGQSAGILFYSRSIYFLHRMKRKRSE
ncbi:MAG: hypothetical protein A3C47_00980 [Omnitrophica bacterium RIFCSPHIGHO2_02_FULL_51_18]|nr:MAG: hypothetical protein A3C47_00980 [Omnitrophica bacterium RIFCSPHIGHO2_02_FULL_51_18]